MSHLKRLKALDAALTEATHNGTLDHLPSYLPTEAINAFCDAVQEAIDDYDTDLNPEPLHPFTVIYSEPATITWLFFETLAADSDRAEAQLMDAYPTATALWINTGHGPNSRTQDDERDGMGNPLDGGAPNA